MCGLAGFVGLSRRPEHYEHDLRSMMTAIGHRGPEEFGYCLDDHGAVGLVRLAIIDLPLGKQPMAIAGDRYWIAFNGTIVNYLELRAELEAQGIRFRTDSDTEVLGYAVATWGGRALERLNGSFAFAIYDRVQRSVTLARDPVGERPLFYSFVHGGIAFASEIKGIFALPQVPRQLSPTGLTQTFKTWSPIDPVTCFENIHALLPGHYGIYQDGRLEIIPYFRIPMAEELPEISGLTFGQAKEQLREQLTESVKVRLRSDYGVGVLVSGGIDSAAIAAIASQELGEPPRTFSFTLPSSPLDESKAQERVVQHLGTCHSSVEITPELTRRLFPEAVYHAETPLFRTSAVAIGQLAKHVHDQGYRVVLFGPGSDELLCGYDTAKEAFFLEKYDSFPSDADRRRWLVSLFHDTALTKTFSPDALIDFYRDPETRKSGLGPQYRRFSLLPNLSDLARAEVSAADNWPEMIRDSLLRLDPRLLERNEVEQSRAIDLLTVISGWGMNAYGDRVTVPEGVEFRAPFLDSSVIRFAWGLAENFTLGDGRGEKIILRESFSGLLPSEVVQRRKQGLRAYGAESLRPTAADDWVRDVTSRAMSGASEIIDPAKAKTLVDVIAAQDGEPRYPFKHAYCLMLSTVLLEDRFLRDFRVPDASPQVNIVKRVDKRSTASAPG